MSGPRLGALSNNRRWGGTNTGTCERPMQTEKTSSKSERNYTSFQIFHAKLLTHNECHLHFLAGIYYSFKSAVVFSIVSPVRVKRGKIQGTKSSS